MEQLDRELALSLYSAGYQHGGNDTVEGAFSDDPHGEAVDEIIADHQANTETEKGAEG